MSSPKFIVAGKTCATDIGNRAAWCRDVHPYISSARYLELNIERARIGEKRQLAEVTGSFNGSLLHAQHQPDVIEHTISAVADVHS